MEIAYPGTRAETFIILLTFMVSKMEGIIVPNLRLLGLILPLPPGLPPVEMVDSIVTTLLAWGAILAALLTAIREIWRRAVLLFHPDQALGQLSKEKGKLRVEGDMSFLGDPRNSGIAERVDLALGELQDLVTTKFPEVLTLLQQIFQLKSQIYQDLEKRFHGGGSDAKAQ